jgi:putative ABC transport system permease protein
VATRSARIAIYRKRFGAVLIAAQIAITLAILVNAAAIIVERLVWSGRPTGIDEANIFFVYAENIEAPMSLAAINANDIAALRSLPGVLDAYTTNSYPLQGGGWQLAVTLTADQKTPSAMTAYYFGDAHALNTLGLRLVAGRNFTPTEIVERDANTAPPVGGLIVTRALAEKLFPGGHALGKAIFVESTTVPVPIIGIVERLQGPFIGASGITSTFVENSIVAPYRFLTELSTYVARCEPGQLDKAMKAAQATLATLNPNRIIKVSSMLETRAEAYRTQRGLAGLLGAVALTLVAVTAFGMVGLTSYWVSQRRRQIGIRRALGATRLAILRQFQRENLIIAGAGVVAGCALAIALNIWLVGRFEMVRIGNGYIVGGGLAMLLLGQVAVFLPASRAMQIPPATAARGG